MNAIMRIPVLDQAVPPIAVGTMYFGTRVPPERAHQVLDRARDLGATFLDTANNYAFWEPGGTGDESELCLGSWFASAGAAARDDVVLATKVGARPSRPGGTLDDALGLAPDAITAQVEGSLGRLGVDHVDLVYAHIDDPAVPPEDVVGALQGLVERGVARAFGASNLTADRLTTVTTAAGAGRRHAALQNRFSYLLPRPGGDLHPHVLLDDDVEEVTQDTGMLAVGYSPLMEGAYVRLDRPLHAAYGDRAVQAPALAALADVAAEAGLDAGQAVLAWMTQRSEPVLPVVGLSTIEQLEDAWQAVHTTIPPTGIAALEQARRI